MIPYVKLSIRYQVVIWYTMTCSKRDSVTCLVRESPPNKWTNWGPRPAVWPSDWWLVGVTNGPPRTIPIQQRAFSLDQSHTDSQEGEDARDRYQDCVRTRVAIGCRYTGAGHSVEGWVWAGERGRIDRGGQGEGRTLLCAFWMSTSKNSGSSLWNNSKEGNYLGCEVGGWSIRAGT